MLQAAVLFTLFAWLMITGLHLLARDECLDAGGQLFSGDICVIPGEATQHMLGVLRLPGVIFTGAVALGITTGLWTLCRFLWSRVRKARLNTAR